MSGSPDALNTNAALRFYAAQGFQKAFPDALVSVASYEEGPRIARAVRPHLTLVFGSVMLDQCAFDDVAEETKCRDGTLAFWLHDDPYEFDMNTRILPLADVVFSNDRASLDFYPPDLPVYHLPLAASAEAHLRPVGPRSGPDLFFCGHRFDNRSRFLAELGPHARALRAEVVFAGSGWEQVEGAVAMRLPNSALPDLYSRAVAVLNIGRDESIANRRYGIRPSTPGPRTFEAASAGAAQIVVGAGLEIEDYFTPGKEVLLADDVLEFVTHWERLMKDHELSCAVGRNAQQRALAEHGYDARARRIMDVVFR